MANKVTVEFDADEINAYLEILYEVTDKGPPGDGWQSDELKALIAKLEESAGIPEEDRW